MLLCLVRACYMLFYACSKLDTSLSLCLSQRCSTAVRVVWMEPANVWMAYGTSGIFSAAAEVTAVVKLCTSSSIHPQTLVGIQAAIQSVRPTRYLLGVSIRLFGVCTGNWWQPWTSASTLHDRFGGRLGLQIEWTLDEKVPLSTLNCWVAIDPQFVMQPCFSYDNPKCDYGRWSP